MGGIGLAFVIWTLIDWIVGEPGKGGNIDIRLVVLTRDTNDERLHRGRGRWK